MKSIRKLSDSENQPDTIESLGSVLENCVKDIRDFDVAINNVVWKVRFIKADSRMAQLVNGLCDTNEYVIGISTKIEKFAVVVTLFHEIEHAITSAVGRSNSQLDEEINADTNGMAWPLIIAQLPLWVIHDCIELRDEVTKCLTKTKGMRSIKDGRKTSNKRTRAQNKPVTEDRGVGGDS